MGEVNKRSNKNEHIFEGKIAHGTKQANNEYVSRDMNNELYRRQKANIRIPGDKRCLVSTNIHTHP